MSLLSDLRVLYHLTLAPVRGSSHAQRMESFYSGQAAEYDEFRKRLLSGREDLFAAIDVPEDGVWVDMGGGTGSNLELLGDRIERLRKVYVVDLSSSLLGQVRHRAKQRGWDHVETVQADATAFTPPEEQVDLVTFSYSLTMIPDWFAALSQARQLLRPGGQIGVVDFYVSRKYPDSEMHRHGWLTRTFWPIWFASDNVHLSPDHLPFLRHHFTQHQLSECMGKIPLFPLVRAPYYWFVGTRNTVESSEIYSSAIHASV